MDEAAHGARQIDQFFHDLETREFAAADRWLGLQDFRRSQKTRQKIINYTKPLVEIESSKRRALQEVDRFMQPRLERMKRDAKEAGAACRSKNKQRHSISSSIADKMTEKGRAGQPPRGLEEDSLL